MNALVRTNGWRPAFSLFNDFDSLLDRYFGQDADTAEWRLPPVDVVEDDNGWKVTLDVPGYAREDIRVEARDGLLTISGETRRREETREGRVLRQERRNGRFQRTLRLREDIDAGAIAAVCRDGVLTLTLPRAASARARRIEVQVA